MPKKSTNKVPSTQLDNVPDPIKTLDGEFNFVKFEGTEDEYIDALISGEIDSIEDEQDQDQSLGVPTTSIKKSSN